MQGKNGREENKMTNIFSGLFDSAGTKVISAENFMLCVGAALLIGGAIAWTAGRKKGSSFSFLVSLAALPVLSCVTIMMVNGNVGAGVATAGAFSLVRFRSAAGTAREIVLIFLAMVCGLIAGMGYLAYAVLFCLLLCLLFLGLGRLDPERNGLKKTLRITVPEDLDYEGALEEPLHHYCSAWTLKQAKTVNMGSLFRLTYEVTMKPEARAKALIDDLRCLNGNLEIAVGTEETVVSEL